MKRLMVFVLMIVSLSTVYAANVSNGREHGQKVSRYYKGNISSDDLPKSIIKYLEKEYPDYTIMISKRKNNGTYFVKIRYNGNKYRQYYRSLVFDHEGGVIKG